LSDVGWSVNVPTVTPVVPPATCAYEIGVGTVTASDALPTVNVPDELVWTVGVIVVPDVAPTGDGAYEAFTPALKVVVGGIELETLHSSASVKTVPFGTVSEFWKMKFDSTLVPPKAVH